MCTCDDDDLKSVIYYCNTFDIDIIIISVTLICLLPLNAHTCLVYAARIRGAVFQEHCGVVSYL